MKMNWKKRLTMGIALAVACVMIGYAGAGMLNTNAQAENTVTTVVTSPFTQAVSEVRDSVVGINNYQTVRYSNGFGGSSGWGDFFGWGNWGYGDNYGNGRGNGSVEEQEVLAGSGSGVVVGDGYVLTNFHVVEDASSLKVTMGENEYDAVLVAYDENLDIAVVQASELKAQPVRLGDSDSLQVGDWAICIGNPLGEKFAGTVTAGIISALDRSVSSTNTDKYGRRETITNTMIQTDAAINNGNSGGGMFSVSGELMGIPTLKYSGSAYSGATIEGIGMCIPINAAKPLIEDVLSGKVRASNNAEAKNSAGGDLTMIGRPRMGVSITGLNPRSSAVASGKLPNGVYVSEVEKNGPADLAGMQAGDIIVEVDGSVITGTQQLQSIIAAHSEGDVLKIKVYRVANLPEIVNNGDEIPDGEYVDLEVMLAVVDTVKQ